MAVVNELIMDGVGTSSFPFRIIIKESPVYDLKESKSQLLEHGGINGAIVQSNRHRPMSRLEYTFQLIEPTETEVHRFLAVLSREGVWLEDTRVPTTRRWCYKVEDMMVTQETPTVYLCRVVFVCHPTKFFKEVDTQVLRASGVLRPQGSALAFPTIRIEGNSSSETTLTVGRQVIRLERLTEPVVMVNDPTRPSFQTVAGKSIKWAGDFFTVDAVKGEPVGVVFGPGISLVTFETVWGWM